MISHGLVLDELPSHTEALTHAETPSAVQQILVDQVQKLATQRKRQSTSSAEVKSIKEIKARLAGEEPPAEDADEEMQMTEVSLNFSPNPFSPYVTPHSPHISEFNSSFLNFLVVAVVREGGQMGWASNGGGLQMGAGFKWGRASNASSLPRGLFIPPRFIRASSLPCTPYIDLSLSASPPPPPCRNGSQTSSVPSRWCQWRWRVPIDR